MLCLETIEPDTLELLSALQRDPVFADTRLVGGTALALQLGHRKSVDLDFFGRVPVSGSELEQALSAFGAVALANRSRLVETYFVRDIKMDVVDYPYPWLDAGETTGQQRGVRVAMTECLTTTDDETENVVKLSKVKHVEELIKVSGDHSEMHAHAVEGLLFGNGLYLEDNAFSTSHQLVNVYAKPEKRYEVRSEDTAIDVQLHETV
ncbi:MAG: nucleotidyl transferase AbiEii/AbiGii toxin family protein [bacterium]